MTQEYQPYQNPDLEGVKLAYCQELARTGAPLSAAHSVGWTRRTLSKEKKEDPVFREAISEASRIAGERILLELSNRAYNGEETPAINQGMPIYKRDPKTGDIELDDNFEPIVLVYRKHDKQYLFKLMDALMPEMRQGSTSVNIHAGAQSEDEDDEDKGVIRVELVMPNGRTEEYYDAIERGEE